MVAQKINRENKKIEKVPSLKVAEIVLVQCNLADNKYQQKSEVLHTFPPNNLHAYLLNVEPSNLVLLKTYNTEFGEIVITFTNQTSIPLEDKVNFTLLINKYKRADILLNQKQENLLNDMDASKKVAHKADE